VLYRTCSQREEETKGSGIRETIAGSVPESFEPGCGIIFSEVLDENFNYSRYSNNNRIAKNKSKELQIVCRSNAHMGSGWSRALGYTTVLTRVALKH